MSAALHALERDYRSAFLGYLTRRDEVPLHAAYELGRRAAATEGVSLLDLARVHHDVFRRALDDTRPDEIQDLVDAASTFFLEVLATHHMLGVAAQDARQDGDASGEAGSEAGSDAAAPVPRSRSGT